jgi:hypothetical protein
MLMELKPFIEALLFLLGVLSLKVMCEAIIFVCFWFLPGTAIGRERERARESKNHDPNIAYRGNFRATFCNTHKRTETHNSC